MGLVADLPLGSGVWLEEAVAMGMAVGFTFFPKSSVLFVLPVFHR